jgi:hypothetical protein
MEKNLAGKKPGLSAVFEWLNEYNVSKRKINLKKHSVVKCCDTNGW